MIEINFNFLKNLKKYQQTKSTVAMLQALFQSVETNK